MSLPFTVTFMKRAYETAFENKNELTFTAMSTAVRVTWQSSNRGLVQFVEAGDGYMVTLLEMFAIGGFATHPLCRFHLPHKEIQLLTKGFGRKPVVAELLYNFKYNNQRSVKTHQELAVLISANMWLERNGDGPTTFAAGVLLDTHDISERMYWAESYLHVNKLLKEMEEKLSKTEVRLRELERQQHNKT